MANNPNCLPPPTIGSRNKTEATSWAPLVEHGMERANLSAPHEELPDMGYLLALEAVPRWSKDAHARKGEGTKAKVPQ